MIMPMRAGRRGKRRLKKRGKVLQMPFVVVNTCTFKVASLFSIKDLSISVITVLIDMIY